MAHEPLVLMVRVEGAKYPQAIWRLESEWPWLQLVTKQRGDDYAYADLVRFLWRLPVDLVICEQDVVAPVGAIEELLHCPHEWCTHPHWLGDRHQLDTLGLARFSHSLRRRLPELAEAALAAPDHLLYSLWGLTRVPADSSPGTLHRQGPRACLRPGAQLPRPRLPCLSAPSTVDWVTVDSHLSRSLHKAGVHPHVHPRATMHLRFPLSQQPAWRPQAAPALPRGIPEP